MARAVFSINSIAIAICLLVVFSVPSGESARILGFFTSPSKSHNLIHCAIADTLAKAGHNVTVVGTIPNVYKKAKYNYIQIGEQKFEKGFISESVNNPQPFYKKMGSILNQITTTSNSTMMHPKMQQFLRDNGEFSFDLLIIGYFMNDFQLGLGAHFKCPVIVSFMIRSISVTNEMVGNPHEISYVPLLFGDGKQPLNFLSRVKNFILSLFDLYGLMPLLNFQAQRLYDYHFPSDRYPSLDVMRKNISLVFTNHHFSQGPIRPDVPAVIEIGGIQIKEKPDPLPTDIARILDNAKEGVIYFSLGSNVQGTNLREDKAKIMFDVLSKLPYTVLWKWGDSDFPGTSPNIIYKSWLPQDDILAHPNVKLFITHGGQGSVVESQYHGVPMVGIPLFGDQPSNMINVVNSGFGLSLDYISLTEESFENAINEVLHNPKYTQAVKAFSELYRDRPMTPRQLVNYWVDYVLRHNGAKHMQSPAVFMNKWQLMSLDVIGFILAIVVIAVAVFVKICQFLFCRNRKAEKMTKKSVTKSKKNK